MKYVVFFFFLMSIFLCSCKEEQTVIVSELSTKEIKEDTIVKEVASENIATSSQDSKIDLETAKTDLAEKSPKQIKKIPKKKEVKPKITKPVAIPKISFKSDQYDFGRIVQGEKILHEYVFSNIGNKPLVITDAVATCGCTKPIYPFAPIEAGETGKILIQFNSKGRLGRQSPTIKVFSNSGKEPIVLKLIGEVITEEFRDTLAN